MSMEALPEIHYKNFVDLLSDLSYFKKEGYTILPSDKPTCRELGYIVSKVLPSGQEFSHHLLITFENLQNTKGLPPGVLAALKTAAGRVKILDLDLTPKSTLPPKKPKPKGIS